MITTTKFCKSTGCTKATVTNGYCGDCFEKGLESLLNRLKAEPLSKERQEFGMMLMRHIDDLSESELKRYNELKEILKN